MWGDVLMDRHSRDQNNLKFRELIPRCFRSASGVDHHEFLICTPWHHPYRYAENSAGRIAEFDTSAFCSVAIEENLTPMLVRKSTNPIEFEAVILFGQLLFASTRLQKYLTLHKAYECLVSNRDIRLSAIRHALAHPGSTLTNLRTRHALTSVFGDAQIDFKKHVHVRLFYETFGELLIAVDKTLSDRLVAILAYTYAVPPDIKLLHDWRVDGAD
jgi:hypothetical protein